MKTCPFCNAEIAENARFCLHCMATLEEKEKIQIPTNNKRWMFHLSAALVFISILTIVLLIVEKNLTPNIPPKEVSTTQSTYENVSSHTNTSHTLVSNSSTSNSEITSTDNSESSVTKKPKKANSSKSSSVKASSKTNISSSKKSNSSSSKASSSSSSSKPPVPPFTYTLIDNEIHIVKGNENLSGAITIPNTIDGYPVTQISALAFKENTKITSVTIPESIKSIGEYAFADCKNLAVVNFSEGLNFIGAEAFIGCNIKTLTLPDSIVTIGNNAFDNCRNLTNVILPSNLERIELELFAGCTNLTTITLPKELKLVVEAAFTGCNNITTVYYPGNEADREKISWGCQDYQLDHATWYYEVER